MIRRVLGASWLPVLLLLAACGGGGGGGPSTVAVPNVNGLAQASAVSALTAAGLTYTVTTQSSGTAMTGSVISQTPAAGTQVAAGSSVSLVVSSGPAPVTVPNVVGLTQAAAATAITSAGLTPGNVTTQASATIAAGSVVSQNPAAGAVVPMGMNVSLVVSLGPPVAVPNVVGLTQAAATTAITGIGLTVGAVTTQLSATVPAGNVIAESPTAGTSVAPGSTVALTVSSGPPAVVPNVVGLSQSAAITTIAGVGLVLGSVTTQTSATAPAGQVISQTPAANAAVAPGSAVSLFVSTGTAPANTLAVTIDGGPPGVQTGNALFATVTLCTPGSTTACQSIDHVLVDTGSVGLQILSETLNGSVTPTAIENPATNTPIMECVQFADGYSWGSMVVADVVIGQRRIANLPMHLIGDAAAGSAPASCVRGPSENTVASFAAKGVLGIGYWQQDCGQACVDGAPSGVYYTCSNQSCQSTPVALDKQMQNPIAQFELDSNGVLIDLPSVNAPGAATLQGTVYFGVGTQSNNALGAAGVYTVDGIGNLYTIFGGLTEGQSFIDSGSNGYFFDSTLKACTSATGFYCPAASTAESATIQGQNGTSSPIQFTVDNAESLFAVPNLTAFPNLAGPNGSLGTSSNGFDWGLPFFFGRRVFVIFENTTVNGTAGPASAF